MHFLTLGSHYPTPEHTEEIFEAIKKVADVARDLKGFVETGAWLDKGQERIVVLSLWESPKSAIKARQVLKPLIMQSASTQNWSDRYPRIS